MHRHLAPDPSRAARVSLVVLVVLSAACRSGCPAGCDTPSISRPSGTATSSPGSAKRFGGARPVDVMVAEVGARGLLLALHGYGDRGSNFARALGLPELARRAGLVLVAPDGSLDPRHHRFWNASEACCDFFGAGVDDVAYLLDLITEVAAAYRIDADRRYVLGLSNGAFMAHRLACESADALVAIVAIAGTSSSDLGHCRPRRPVSVLQVHGEADAIISYRGGEAVLGLGKGRYPGAPATVERWGQLDGCTGGRVRAKGALDLTPQPGSETTVEHIEGCPAGIDVRLLTIGEGAHVPGFRPAFLDFVADWLHDRGPAALTRP